MTWNTEHGDVVEVSGVPHHELIHPLLLQIDETKITATMMTATSTLNTTNSCTVSYLLHTDETRTITKTMITAASNT